MQTHPHTHDQLVPWADQPRRHFDDDALDQLADSISAHGLMQNIVARRVSPEHGGGDISALRPSEILAGERRYRAIARLIEQGRDIQGTPADAYAIPVQVLFDLEDADALELSTIENVQRDALTPLEEADAFLRLSELGRDTAELAQRVGKTDRHVQLRIALARGLSPRGRDALAGGAITLAQARELCRASHDMQDAALEAIAADRWGHWNTAEVVRENLWNRTAPAEHAWFTREAYLEAGGEILPDPGDPGKERYVSWPIFARLQHEAAKARAQELKQHRAWVETIVDYGLRLPWGRFEHQKKGKAETLGAVICIDQRTLEVALHDRLTKAKPAGRAGGDDSAKTQREADLKRRGGFSKTHLTACEEIRTRALQVAVMADPRAAKAALIAGLLGWSGVKIRTETPHTIAGKVSEAIRGEPDTLGKRDSWHYDRDRNAGDLLEHLLVAEDAELDRLLAMLVAERVDTTMHYEPVLGTGQALDLLAEATEAQALIEADGPVIDADWLKRLGKESLRDLAGDVYGRDDDLAASGTGKAIRDALTGDPALTRIMPPELAFGTTETVRERLAKRDAWLLEREAARQDGERRSRAKAEPAPGKPASADQVAALQALAETPRRVLIAITQAWGNGNTTTVADLHDSLGISTGAASNARKALRELGLLDDANTPTDAGIDAVAFYSADQEQAAA